jgi:hemolysin III
VSHRVAAIASLPVGLWLVARAPSGTSRFGVAVFAACIAGMFAASAVMHWRAWSPNTTEVLNRADHTAIYLAIAGTATAVAALGLSGGWQAALLWGVWGIAAIGIVIEWVPAATPRGLAHTLYLVLGWATVPFVPLIASRTGWGTVALMLAGGLFYTVGAVIVAIRRPDPRPEVFGYHEVWHLFVVVAVGFHYAMVAEALPAV